MFKRQAVKRVFAMAATIVSIAGLGMLAQGTASAATGKPLAAAGSSALADHSIKFEPAVACSYASGVREKSASWKNGNETRTVYLWWSSTTRCVWAVEVHGQPGDAVYVYNKDTGAQATTYIQSGQSSATTGEISDLNTKSHACMIPLLSNGSNGPKTCTAYF
jgi:hypothetical protein